MAKERCISCWQPSCKFVSFTSILFCLCNAVLAIKLQQLGEKFSGSIQRTPQETRLRNVGSRMKDISSILNSLGPDATSPLDYAITHPARVDHKGQFLSHDVKHFTRNRHQDDIRSRKKRDVEAEKDEDVNLYFTIRLEDKELILNVSENKKLVHPNFVVERLSGEEEKNARWSSRTPPHQRSSIERGSNWPCHFRGHVMGHPQSAVAMSTCDGLTGLIRLREGDYFIEPLVGASPDEQVQRQQPHKIYKREIAKFSNEAIKPNERPITSDTHRSSRKKKTIRTSGHHKAVKDPVELQAPDREKNEAVDGSGKEFCGVKDTKRQYQRDLRARKRWEARRDPRRIRHTSSKRHRRTSSRRHRRSLSLEHWIEMMVVVDKKMVEHYEASHYGGAERYVLTIVNMVSELFHDVSIGNALNIALIRLIILEGEENGLKVLSHAEKTLDNFCRWAKRMNPRSDHHANHHDVAVLLTRQNICSHSNTSCETLGLAHVAGMCQSHRSCSVNQDTGLSLAFTVAHELGHNFAMHHDGQLNSCEPSDKYPRVMAPHLTSNNLPMRWSSCSRRYVTRFLDRNWGFCLMDLPSSDHDRFDFPVELPGVLYDADHQCRLMFGSHSRQCRKIDDMCSRLWCVYKGTCRSRLHAAVPGTKCAPGRWCYSGRCVRVGNRPSAVDGSWSPWSKWSRCSRTCGVGVTFSARYCNQPAPRHGGRFCLGERRRYKTCNVWSCSKTNTTVSFRTEQCAAFNNVLYRNHTYNWHPVDSTIYPCELHCYTRDIKEPFADRLRDKVVDGTKCFSHGNDICVDGICKHLGCDSKIDSMAEEDKCGVCRGDGLSCSEVNTTFDILTGEEYVQLGLIPKGARNIRIHEVAPSGNFLALRNPTDEDDFYLNGNYMIQWNFQFDLAGTVFNYKRMNKTLDNITADGPVTHDIAVMLLFVEENPGVQISYILAHNVSAIFEEMKPEFEWVMQPWTSCSRTCGYGVQVSLASCVEKKAGIVEEDFCDVKSRPEDIRRMCSNPKCRPEWFSGPWQSCSVTCGGGMGRQKRTVLCIRSINNDEQVILNRTECRESIEPENIRSCSAESQVPCPSWRNGKWGNCSKPCGGGDRNRTVTCVTYIIDDVIAIDEDQGHSDHEYSDLPFVGRMDASYRRGRRARLTFNKITSIKRRKRKNLLENFDYDVENDGECDAESRPMSTEPCNTNECEVVALRSRLFGISSLSTSSNVSQNDPLLQVEILKNRTDDPHFDKDFDVNEDLNTDFNSSLRSEGSSHYEDLLDVISPLPIAQYANDTAANSTAFTAAAVTTTWTKTEGSAVGNATTGTPATTTAAPSNTAPTTTTSATTTTEETVTLTPKWLAGHWGQCSTTCGVGARIRNVICSAGPGNCKGLVRPAPAQRCNLKPCAAWFYGNWTKCSRSCGKGRRRRKIRCRDSRTKRLIRPYHCSSVPKLRRINATCDQRSCLPWRTSRWSVCNVSCGTGTQRRRVACSKKGKCDPDRRPVGQKNCLLRECASWKASHWPRCPVNCGYGIKRRVVRCVERDRGRPSQACDPRLKPARVKKCNKGPCRVTDYDFSSCVGDRLKSRFCKVLRRWGKCVQPSLAIQCCQTCKTFINVRRKDKIS